MCVLHTTDRAGRRRAGGIRGRRHLCTWMRSREPRCRPSGTSTGRGRVRLLKTAKGFAPTSGPEHAPGSARELKTAAATRSDRTGDRRAAHADLGARRLGQDRAAPHLDGPGDGPRAIAHVALTREHSERRRVLARRARGRVARAARAHGAGRPGARLAPARRACAAALDRIDAPLIARARRLPGGRHGRRRSPTSSRCSSSPIPPLRLVLATRSDPPMRLQRLRLAGELVESARRTSRSRSPRRSELLQPLELAPADVETLWARTEGWVAALRLAALSLQAHPDPSAFITGFAGDDRAVADYLTSEVLERLRRGDAAGSCSARPSSSG